MAQLDWETLYQSYSFAFARLTHSLLLKSKSAEKKKSFGLQITKERLALLNQDTKENTFFEVEDLYDNTGKATGTKVTLKIRLSESMNEYSRVF